MKMKMKSKTIAPSALLLGIALFCPPRAGVGAKDRFVPPDVTSATDIPYPVEVVFNPGDSLNQSMKIAPVAPTPPPFPAGYLPPEVSVGSFALYQPNSVGVGTVVLDVTIDKYGVIKKTDVIRDVPSLTPEAIAAVKRWTINAATFNGKAIASKLVVAYVFRSPTMTTR